MTYRLVETPAFLCYTIHYDLKEKKDYIGFMHSGIFGNNAGGFNVFQRLPLGLPFSSD